MAETAQERIDQRLQEIQSGFGKNIVELLEHANQAHLLGKGQVTAQPTIDRASLRWSLTWQVGQVSLDLNIVIGVEDNGRQANVDKVYVHRHASSDYNFAGHTPTTRMKRLSGLSIAEIKEGIEAEFK